METKEELILNGNINKAIINLSIPLMINSFIQTLYSLVDGLYLSRLGTVEFAATSLVFPVIWLFLTFCTRRIISFNFHNESTIGDEKRKKNAADIFFR